MEKKIIMDKNIAVPCVYCGNMPIILRYEADLYYAQCSNLQCKKHNDYDFVGMRPSVAIDRWNLGNRKINYKKKTK